jgi:hypothetical protein
MKIRRMRIARRIPTAPNTRPEYVLLSAFPLQQWFHESAMLLRYTYIVFVVLQVFFLYGKGRKNKYIVRNV